MKKITTKDIISKKNKEKVVMITAYDALFASLADAANVDIILVGDSVGNTFLGHDSTVAVDLNAMLHHTKAVARANTKALVVSDMPFGLAHYSFDRLLDSARALIQEGGASAVKIEGATPDILEKIAKLSDAGIAIVGHIGLEPQQILKLGSYKKAGKTLNEAEILISQAKALEKAGVFCIVLELCDSDVASLIRENINIPLIGIGSGLDCDGQVLVCTDILGLGGKYPSFSKQYANLKDTVIDAFSAYADEVRSSKFPK
ncbi:MAG: 3-methyl-2-oxobutanoate hydroxymethyltransferase [Opitutales bacterium]